MRRTIAITITAAALVGATVGCSSNDDEDAVRAWCDKIIDVDGRASTPPSDQSQQGAYAAAVIKDIRTVIRTAPDDIAADINEVGTAAIKQMSPGPGPDPDESSRAARARLRRFVLDNCDGYDINDE
jgi:hypothetical protein